MIGKTINEEIVLIANKYIGQEEIRGNKGFKDIEFNRLMDAVGHEKGQAWCAYFAELVWKEAYQNWDATLFSRLDKLFSASAVTTFRNFHKTKDFTTPRKPSPGCLAIWQKYKDGKAHWSGHIGVVDTVNKNISFTCIEGNTNEDGGREGYMVGKKNRIIDFEEKQNALVLIGFVQPKEI